MNGIFVFSIWVWGAVTLISAGYKAMKKNSFKYTKKDFKKYKKME